jgi:hypothetical protein
MKVIISYTPNMMNIFVEEECWKDPDAIMTNIGAADKIYLTYQIEGVRANHIYARVMDTNTPIDKSADINNVEYLWRKRVHIDETPKESSSIS